MTPDDPLRGKQIRWSIPPPICELGDGRFADRVYFDAAGKSTQLCTPHYNNALDVEIAARDEKLRIDTLAQMKKERLEKLKEAT